VLYYNKFAEMKLCSGCKLTLTMKIKLNAGRAQLLQHFINFLRNTNYNSTNDYYIAIKACKVRSSCK